MGSSGFLWIRLLWKVFVYTAKIHSSTLIQVGNQLSFFLGKSLLFTSKTMYTKAKIGGKIFQEYFKHNLSFKIMKKKERGV